VGTHLGKVGKDNEAHTWHTFMKDKQWHCLWKIKARLDSVCQAAVLTFPPNFCEAQATKAHCFTHAFKGFV